MKNIFLIMLIAFSIGQLFAGGESQSNTKPKVDRNSWKQSKVNLKYNDGPNDADIKIFLNGSYSTTIMPGQNILVNCLDGNNFLDVVTPNDSKRIEFESDLNITFLEFNITPEPMNSKITISLKNGKKSSSVNLLVNGVLKSTIGLSQSMEIDVSNGNNLIELQSGKYKETINVSSNSNNTFIEFNTSSVLAKIEDVKLVKVNKLSFFRINDLEIVKTEIVTMPDELQKQIEEEDKQIAEEESKRKAREEANRYDPAKFVIIPSYFSPSSYTKADLFDAVAASEKLQAYLQLGTYEEFDIFGVYSKDFVSDVVFVNQNGTDITFRTQDNAISRRMKVDSRTGLTAGQKVRIYYRVYKIRDWRIDAIERL